MASEYSMVYAITHDLHEQALVVAEGHSVEELCDLLGQWHDAGVLGAEERGMVQTAYDSMRAPSDGLLGTVVSGTFTLPGLNGLQIHLQGI